MSAHVGPERTRRDRGQATVEVALVLPVVVLLGLAVVQVGVLAYEQLLVTAATREAVRAAAVSTVESDARRAAETTGHLDPARLTVSVTRASGEGAVVRVDVRYTAPTDVPLVGVLLPEVPLSAHAAMRGET